MTEKDAIIAANAAFYVAFAAGDVEEVIRLWADDDDISCVHPGWPPIIGLTTVIGSWRDILENPARPHIVCVEPYAIIDGDSGRVLCIEIVNGTALAACNAFRRIGDAWRLVHHQSSPIAEIVTAANDDGASRRVH
ncbi:MAG TPA: nuclear transport factor 2 family protein [Bradyrhizobium sp.]